MRASEGLRSRPSTVVAACNCMPNADTVSGGRFAASGGGDRRGPASASWTHAASTGSMSRPWSSPSAALETDVDCGGGLCPKCELDQLCELPLDCTSDLCIQGTCALPRSCLQIHQNDPQAASGVYTIDADGPGGAPAVPVFCDQVTDGGGWTMLFSAGVAGDPTILWNGPAVNEGDQTLLGPQKSGKHYVSGYIEKFWNQGGVVLTEARVRSPPSRASYGCWIHTQHHCGSNSQVDLDQRDPV